LHNVLNGNHFAGENGMKALIISDEINQFHWAMLKSVLLILSLLPISQGILTLWNATEGSSQIMVGFFAISVLSALFVLCFWSALKATVLNLKQEHASALEHSVVKIYRYIPMLFLAAMMSYLVTQL
jgi:hypothetical protein